MEVVLALLDSRRWSDRIGRSTGEGHRRNDYAEHVVHCIEQSVAWVAASDRRTAETAVVAIMTVHFCCSSRNATYELRWCIGCSEGVLLHHRRPLRLRFLQFQRMSDLLIFELQFRYLYPMYNSGINKKKQYPQ